MAKATSTVPTAPVYDPYPLDVVALLRLFIVGALVGLTGWALYLAISHFFVVPVFCRTPETFSICNNGGTIAWVAAHIIAMTAAVAVLARMAVYRPLLVALAVLISLWGAHSWLGGLTWYAGLLWQAILFGLAMTLFGWIARLSNFIIALIATIILIILSRVVLLAA